MTFTANFGKTVNDYAAHREGFPPELIQTLQQRGLCQPGHRVWAVFGRKTSSLY